MNTLFKNYGLAFVLAALFLICWAGQTWSVRQEFQTEQADHGQAAAVFGTDGLRVDVLHATLENWQSEFLQLLTFVVLMAHLVFKGSHESKDADEPIITRLEQLQADIRELKASRGPAAGAHAALRALEQ